MATTDKPQEATDKPQAPAPAAAPAPQTMVLSAHEYKHMQATQAMQQAAELNMDTAPDGGRYRLPDGSVVDANGQPLKGKDAG